MAGRIGSTLSLVARDALDLAGGRGGRVTHVGDYATDGSINARREAKII